MGADPFSLRRVKQEVGQEMERRSEFCFATQPPEMLVDRP